MTREQLRRKYLVCTVTDGAANILKAAFMKDDDRHPKMTAAAFKTFCLDADPALIEEARGFYQDYHEELEHYEPIS
jgi:hypothetical protein